VLLVLGAPCQLLVLAGPEHGRTIPLAVFQRKGVAHEQCPKMIALFSSIALPERSGIEALSLHCQLAQSRWRLRPRRETRWVAKSMSLRPEGICQAQERGLGSSVKSNPTIGGVDGTQTAHVWARSVRRCGPALGWVSPGAGQQAQQQGACTSECR